jgi:hypothetical protein
MDLIIALRRLSGSGFCAKLPKARGRLGSSSISLDLYRDFAIGMCL